MIALFAWFLVTSGALTFAIKANRSLGPIGEIAALAFDSGVTAWFVAQAWTDVRPLLGRPRWAPGEALRTAAFAIVGVTFVVAYFLILFRVLHVPDQRYLPTWTKAGWPLWTAYATICIATPIVEELAFRGFFQARLARLMPLRDALWVQAALFAVLHLSLWAFVSHLVLGLILGRVRDASKSLLPGMALHGVWNAVVLMTEASG